MTRTNGWLNDGLGTQIGAMVCAVLPTGLLAGAPRQQTGLGPAAALALASLALAARLLTTVPRLAAAACAVGLLSKTQPRTSDPCLT